MNTYTNMGNTVYWHKNQLIVRLKASLTHHTSEEHSLDPVQFIIHKLQDVLLDFGLQFIERPRWLCPPANNTVGDIDLVSFCRINPEALTGMGSMPRNGGTAGMGDDDLTLAEIKHLDHGKVLRRALHDAGLSVDGVDVIPHWFKAGTNGNIPTQGCPISPPIPVEQSGVSGQYKLEFSQLPDALQDATGKGVTVLVLDTLPKHDQILKAADQAGSSNMLLQEMTKTINFNYQSLPDIIVEGGDPPKRVVTGKDIYGRHGGFHMADHGLFIAGIVCDLAPEANVECIRVLNDDGVGDVNTLIKALDAIQERMQGGDLANRPVVVNLSLVVLPPEDDIPDGVTPEILKQSQDLLYQRIRCLANQGAIFVASAGNDSDPRMDAAETRFGPRYPAALADRLTAMIPVGAVKQNGDAAMYSNYPGSHGIATYGGDIPKPDPWLPSAMRHIPARVDTADLDALRGVYSAAQYPALSKNDPEPEYAAPNSSAWAYWSGTSFATPLISALAARILQGQDPKSLDVRQAILDVTTLETLWMRVGDNKENISGRMIMAFQVWQPIAST